MVFIRQQFSSGRGSASEDDPCSTAAQPQAGGEMSHSPALISLPLGKIG